MRATDLFIGRVGHYGGHGIDDQDQPFYGELDLASLPGSQGVSLAFRATGIDGTPYHEHCAWILQDANGLTFRSVHDGVAGVACLVHRPGGTAEGDDASWAFVLGDDDPGLDRYRARVEIDFDHDGAIAWRVWWALPGSPLVLRSSVRMTEERATPAG